MTMPDQSSCTLCQAETNDLEWHCVAETYLDRAACNRARSEAGIWLCRVCNDAVHSWMQQNQDEPHAGAQAVANIRARLETALYRGLYGKRGIKE